MTGPKPCGTCGHPLTDHLDGLTCYSGTTVTSELACECSEWTSRPSEQLDALAQEALARPLPWRQRLVAWLMSKVTGISGREGTAGGYWGGVTMRDVLKAWLGRKP